MTPPPVTRAAAALLLGCAAVSAACSRGAPSGSGAAGVAPAVAPACTFANPIGKGADPWVIRHDGWYYFAESHGRSIWVYKTAALTDLRRNGVRVWAAPDTGWNRSNVWAPELHFIDGRWYVYYAAGRAGPPFTSQHAGVLQSAGADPQGVYADRGMLYTGDDVRSGTNPVWAIDLTVGRIGDRLYAVWSGWERPASTDKTPQHLYIAPMADPWTMGGNRVKLSSPTESWERGTQLDIEEGPEFLTHGDVFLVYSTRESWLPAYRLGQLRLTSGGDPLDPAAWVKRGPVFAGAPGVYGVGHASFTTSPDGTEDWIVYHAKDKPKPGWARNIRAQRFDWNADGSPHFGTPTPTGARVARPSGECAHN